MNRMVCRYARGYLARRRARNFHRSIVKIQAGFRKILAQRYARRLKIEVSDEIKVSDEIEVSDEIRYEQMTETLKSMPCNEYCMMHSGSEIIGKGYILHKIFHKVSV